MAIPALLANAIVMPPPPNREASGATLPAMISNARTGFAGLLACAGVGGALLIAAPVAGQSPPQRVISDTPEYCLQLLDRVSELVRIASAPPPEEVNLLSTEGQRMCDQGQTRGGIVRLRRALMLLTRSGDQ
jgi:hypothetical protein